MPAAIPVVRIVDDDASLAGAIAGRFRDAGLGTRHYLRAEDFLEARDWLEPGCLVLDWQLPGFSGAELQRRLHRLGARLPIVAISGQVGPTWAARMVEQGALRFLEKPFADAELLAAVGLAVERDRRARTEVRRLDRLEKRLDSLSDREFETMVFLERGMTSRVIAGEFGRSERTVEQHRAAVFRKLKLASAAELARALVGYRATRAERLSARAATIRAKRRDGP